MNKYEAVFMIDNPSAWKNFSQEGSDAIAALAEINENLVEALEKIISDTEILECYCIPERSDICGYCLSKYALAKAKNQEDN